MSVYMRKKYEGWRKLGERVGDKCTISGQK